MSSQTFNAEVVDAIFHERDQLKAENDKLRNELDQWERLTANIELPECPFTEFQPKDLERENVKLRQQLADVTESMGRVEERCAKLRGLVKYTLLCCERGWPCEECPLCGERMTGGDVDGREITYTTCNARDMAQEVGIEVDA